jgi:hypothetical protein
VVASWDHTAILHAEAVVGRGSLAHDRETGRLKRAKRAAATMRSPLSSPVADDDRAMSRVPMPTATPMPG